MPIILPVLLTLVLLFIVTFWKTILLIRKFRKYDDKIPGPPNHPIFGTTALFQGKTAAGVFIIETDSYCHRAVDSSVGRAEDCRVSGNHIKRCALDIICGAAMGTKVNAQYYHEHPYVKAVEGFNSLAIKHAMNPLYQVNFIFWALGLKKQKDEYLHTMKTFTGDVIAERKAAIESGEVEKETSKRKMNFLDILLNSGETNILSAEDIRQEVDTFMFAGHDTTTTSLSWMCWNMAHNPEIQEKVYEELVNVFGEDPNEEVTSDKLSKLEYTERVLKESKRQVTPVPALQRKLINDMEIDGFTIPSGANVAIAPLALHKNPAVYPDPDKFDPDRFLPDEIAKRNAYDYIPFSAGLRNCIGQKFAQMNEKVMLIYIMKNFRLEPTAGFNATKPMFEPVARPSHGIPVKLIRRI